MSTELAARVATLAVAVALLAGCQRPEAAGAPAEAAPQKTRITVWKSPSCGCCGKWVEHLVEHDFDVEVVEEAAMAPMKAHLGIPTELQSCHTAKVDGYLIEGHVPAADIRRLLAEKPAVRGLAVPGMPVGSPGMEMGERFDAFDVLAFGDGQPVRRFARHERASWSVP